tara:strand:- start:702 stop:1832 length:1131 start_codon:yes stop_codon:yes gene_type:complete
MKTFREYTDVVNPAYAVGGASIGPGMGQYLPTADLNLRAQRNKNKRQMLGPKQTVGDQHKKPIKKSDLDQLEKFADRLFAAVGIDVEFTRHFLDRVNDARNQVQITSAELTRLFKQSFKKYGKVISKLGPDAEAVITDMRTDINMPFVIDLKGGQLELIAKTVMRKKGFKTPNPKLAFEGIGEPNIFSQKNPRIPRKKGQPAGSKKHSDLYTDENPRGTIHGLKFATVQDAKASVKKIENSGKKHAHKIQAAIAMEQRAKEMGKTAEAAVYRAYIEKMKKKTKEKNESLWANIHKKRQRIKRGSGEKMRKKGEKGAPTSAQMKRAKEEVEEEAPDTSDAMKRYKSGKAGFTDIAHLKAKGLIKRSDGTKKKSDKYK